MATSWKVLNSRIGFDGGGWRLRLDRCHTPADVVIDDYPVLEYPNWVTTVALRQVDGKVVLTREYRHATGHVVLGLPGGTVEPEEAALGDAGHEAAAVRELMEETGYLADRIKRVGVFLPNAATHNNRLVVFFAPDVASHAETDPDEETGTKIALQFMDLDELLADIRNEKVVMESGDVAALYAASAYLSGSTPGTNKAA